MNASYHVHALPYNFACCLSGLGSYKSVSRKWKNQCRANLMGDREKGGNRGGQKGKGVAHLSENLLRGK